ncbi:MAG TPA: aminotransferase class IV [Pedobacter sp.]
MTTKYVFINDIFVTADKASLLVTDLSVQRGYGIFDFFKTIEGKPIFLQDHLDRFYHSAQKMHLKISQTRAELQDILTELAKKNDLPDSGIRMTLTGGYAEDGYTLPPAQNLVINQQPLTISTAFNPAGMNLVTYNYQRQLAEIKTLDYAMAIWLQPFIKENKADDVLYHHDGMVKEIPRANFFMVSKAQEIITAKSNVLSGIIRKNILNMENTGLNIVERDFTLEELQNADEAFITSTTKHILPVLNINGLPVGDGKAGKISAQLSALLLEKVRNQS